MSDQLNFVDCLRLVKGGLATWKEKPHNAKWWKRIDGTPIPNDLCVCIAEAFVAEAALRAETPTPRNIRYIWHATNDSRTGSTGRIYDDPLMQQAYNEGLEHGRAAGEPEQAK